MRWNIADYDQNIWYLVTEQTLPLGSLIDPAEEKKQEVWVRVWRRIPQESRIAVFLVA